MIVCSQDIANALIYAYFGLQIFFAFVVVPIWQHVLRVKNAARGLNFAVQRGEISMNTFNGWFAGITVFNIGICTIVMPLLPVDIARFSWPLVLGVTGAWFYVIYWSSWFRNWFLGVLAKASHDR